MQVFSLLQQEAILAIRNRRYAWCQAGKGETGAPGIGRIHSSVVQPGHCYQKCRLKCSEHELFMLWIKISNSYTQLRFQIRSMMQNLWWFGSIRRRHINRMDKIKGEEKSSYLIVLVFFNRHLLVISSFCFRHDNKLEFLSDCCYCHYRRRTSHGDKIVV